MFLSVDALLVNYSQHHVIMENYNSGTAVNQQLPLGNINK